MVSVAPQIVSITFNQTVAQGENAVINCTSLGGPSNDYRWQVNGSAIENETSPQLILSSVAVSTGGEYICSVNNTAGMDSASTYLFISPNITTQPTSMNATNGSMISLTCVAEAFPSPEYQWGRGDEKEIRNDITGQNSTMLTFTPLVFGDEGDYYCNVTSGNSRVRPEVITITSESYCNISSKYLYILLVPKQYLMYVTSTSTSSLWQCMVT